MKKEIIKDNCRINILHPKEDDFLAFTVDVIIDKDEVFLIVNSTKKMSIYSKFSNEIELRMERK